MKILFNLKISNLFYIVIVYFKYFFIQNQLPFCYFCFLNKPMKLYFSILFLFTILHTFSQVKETDKKSLLKTSEQKAKDLAKKAPITSYKIFNIQNDTIIADTTLSIKKEYEYNYLRKDLFGLQRLPNEGQAYNKLYFGVTKFGKYPQLGFLAKHDGYLQSDDIKYYSAATPFTDLYYKSVMEQGQNVQTLVTLNTSKQFNFSIEYKGLRSLGKYINQLSSSGNLIFTANYYSKNKRYRANFHFAAQDILNGENGGIVSLADFESGNPEFDDRPRLQIYLKDANTLLRGRRTFFDQSFRINKKNSENNLFINHQFSYESKVFEFKQTTLESTIGIGTAPFFRFGTPIELVPINDQNAYSNHFNKLAATYENKTLGCFNFFIENFRYNFNFDNEKLVSGFKIPNELKSSINSIGAFYQVQKNKWNFKALISNSISRENIRDLSANFTYKLNPKNNLQIEYQNISKIPNHTFNLLQSNYINYNWTNDFENENINHLSVTANTQFGNATLQVSNLQNHLYFTNVVPYSNYEIVTPFQSQSAISYLSLKVGKEIKYKNWSLDNTFLYQKVAQSSLILNVPQFTSRNTIYYSRYAFKRALYFQTGITLNYFTSYYANNYNPIIGDFFVQTNKKIGNYPALDFFINGRIRQTRIFLKAEHFNSSFSGNKYYSTGNTPSQDFIIRVGVVWNFFQ